MKKIDLPLLGASISFGLLGGLIICMAVEASKELTGWIAIVWAITFLITVVKASFNSIKRRTKG
jgi:hypothetical protein